MVKIDELGKHPEGKMHPSVPSDVYEARVTEHLDNDVVAFDVPGFGRVTGRFTRYKELGMADEGGLLALGTTVKVIILGGEVSHAEVIE
jgi:pimeloyl-ACP methyl ester carboxylesterase